MNKETYEEGSWFGVPLKDSGYAIGMIARMKKGRGTKSVFGYFFGPRFSELPTLEDLIDLNPKDALLICRFGDLGLHNGSWPIIGRHSEWNREEWPMTKFVRIQLISGIGYKVTYDESNPGKMLAEEKCDASEAARYPKDGLLGAGAVETVLASKMDDQ